MNKNLSFVNKLPRWQFSIIIHFSICLQLKHNFLVHNKDVISLKNNFTIFLAISTDKKCGFLQPKCFCQKVPDEATSKCVKREKYTGVPIIYLSPLHPR